ncbi:class I SAM-dependent methyltransferase [Candidatus Microgenomates bacterium]|nr:MAG: class I SAM-dependent methyltransferase [Candidatus Microgenomates bacterium]
MVTRNTILEEQVNYYRQRATEYDEWFLRLYRYDEGKTKNARWFAEVTEVQKALQQFNPSGTVLELACGTGWWTQELVKYAEHIIAVDASNEVITINKQKVGTDKTTFITADLFNWHPDKQYDVVFFSFWLSHVPTYLFDAFWQLVDRALKPGGRVFFIDSLSSEKSHKAFTINNPRNATSTRKLKDGRIFNVIKVFYKPSELKKRLYKLGWKIEVKRTKNYFMYGFGGK